MLCLEAKKAARPTRNLVLTIHSSSSTGEGTGSLAGAFSWPDWLPLGLRGCNPLGLGRGPSRCEAFGRCTEMQSDRTYLGVPRLPNELACEKAKCPGKFRENVRENVRSLYSQGSDCRVIFSPIPVESFPFAVLYPTSRLWSLVTNLWMAICFVNIYKDADLSRGRWSEIN